MSQRTLLEINHDLCPRDNPAELLAWARMMRLYMGGADQAMLPDGVTYLQRRHHSDDCPLPVPPQAQRDRQMAAYVRKEADAFVAGRGPVFSLHSEKEPSSSHPLSRAGEESDSGTRPSPEAVEAARRVVRRFGYFKEATGPQKELEAQALNAALCAEGVEIARALLSVAPPESSSTEGEKKG